MKMRAETGIWLLVSVSILVIVGYVVAGWFDDSEEARVEAFVRQLAHDLPNSDAAEYLNVVDLDTYGFRLSVQDRTQSFGKGDREKFLNAAESWVRVIRGSSVAVRDVLVRIDKDTKLADVQMTIAWERGPESQAMLKKALVSFSAQIVKSGDTYKISRLGAQPARNLIERVRTL